MTWIVTDRKHNAIYIDLNSKDGKALYLAPGQKPRMVAKEASVLHTSLHIIPFEYTPSSSEAEGFTRLKTLMMDPIPAEDHQRYFILAWLISIFLMDYFQARGLLQLIGGSAVGKSKMLERASMLIYGKSLLGRGSVASYTRLATMNPLIFLDNVENRNLGPLVSNFMLLLANGASVTKGLSDDVTVQMQKLNALCMLSSIEPFPERAPEMINRTYTVEAKHKLKQPAYLNDETMKLIGKYRNQMLSDIFLLISMKVLPRLERQEFWFECLETRYEGHSKARLNDHLSMIALILEALLEYLPVAAAPIELQALAIMDQWIASWDGADQAISCAAEGCSGMLTKQELLNFGEILCESCRADILQSPPIDKIMGRTVLAPCNLDTGPWWNEKHKYCTGSRHDGPSKVYICTCPCHSSETKS